MFGNVYVHHTKFLSALKSPCFTQCRSIGLKNYSRKYNFAKLRAAKTQPSVGYEVAKKSFIKQNYNDSTYSQSLPDNDFKTTLPPLEGIKMIDERESVLRKAKNGGKSTFDLSPLKVAMSFSEEKFIHEAVVVYEQLAAYIEDRKPVKQLMNVVNPTGYMGICAPLMDKNVKWRIKKIPEKPFIMAYHNSSSVHYIDLAVKSKQTFSVHDRFGRIMYGDPHTTQDLMEVICFAAHASVGKWRIKDIISERENKNLYLGTYKM